MINIQISTGYLTKTRPNEPCSVRDNTFKLLKFHILSVYLNLCIYDARIKLSMSSHLASMSVSPFPLQPKNAPNQSSEVKFPNPKRKSGRKRICSSGQSVNPTSPLSKSTPNCLLRASFRSSLSSHVIWHSHSSFLPRCSSRISFTAISSRPRFRHSR